MPTSELDAGDYVVYAIDNAGNISEASKLITIQTPVNTPLISNDSEIIIYYNPADKLIVVKSNYELKQINLYDITGKKIKSIQEMVRNVH